MAQVSPPKPVFIISDGTGDTAEKMVRASFLQFHGYMVNVRTYPLVTRVEPLRELFRLAARQQAMVVTTLVGREMRTAAERMATEYRVRHVDLIDGLLTQLEGFLQSEPVGVPGLMHQADARYFRRVEAVEFTVKADDGKEPRMLHEADLVLVGVSRTSKTPLSTFLAHKGFKVGNVPIVFDRPLPPQLFEIDQGRIFALTIQPQSLQVIRRERLRAMRMSDNTNYGDIDYILAELEFAEDLFRSNRTWPVLDVTNKAVEETAANIISVLQDRGYSSPLDTEP